ncbi:MAG: hypothetical protein ABIH52_04430 [Candidatus Aenigmatarchaeota archaeon]
MKGLILIVALIAVVAVSGCTSLDSLCPWCNNMVSYGEDVVVIKDLTAVPSKISAGQQTRITAYIQNQGGAEMEDAVTVSLYNYCKGFFEIETLECPGTPDTTTLETCTIGSLFQDEIKQVSWILSPDKDIPLPITCPEDGMQVYVRYKYKTNGLTTITFINPTELERQMQQGTYKEISSTTITGKGPLKAILMVEDQQPVPASRAGVGTTTTISLQIKNQGNGFPVSFKPDPQKTEEAHISKEDITVYFPRGEEALTMTDTCRFKNGHPEDDIKLINRESSKMLCEINTLTEDQVAKETTRTITVDMEYEYEFRDSVKVEVTPLGF